MLVNIHFQRWLLQVLTSLLYSSDKGSETEIKKTILTVNLQKATAN